MSGRVNRQFGWFTAAASVTLVITTLDVFRADGIPGWLTFAAMVPLVAYHLRLRYGPLNGVNTAESDSVYYLGFLITVAELAATAVAIAKNPDGEMTGVLQRFGVGLAATAYAVFARMHLQQLDTAEQGFNAIEDAKGYLARSQELVNGVDTAIARMIEVAAAAERARGALQKSGGEAVESFKREVEAGAKSSEESLKRLSDLIGEMARDEGVGAWNRAIRRQTNALVGLTSGLEALTGKVGDTGRSLNALGESTGGCSSEADRLKERLGAMLQEQAALSGVAADVRDATEAARSAAEAAAAAAAAIRGMAAGFTDHREAIANATTTAQDMSGKFVALSATVTDADRRLAAATESTSSLATLGSQVQLSADGLARLTDAAAALSKQLTDIDGRLANADDRFHHELSTATDSLARLVASLGSVADLIVTRTQEHQAHASR